MEKPLKCTFNPFKTKAFIINKKVSNNDSNKETTLNSLFENYQNNSFFVKMDIEGAEEFVLRSNEKFFKSHNKIKIACCTYHKQEHAENIENILNDWGYKTSFSDGYMLDFPFNDFAAPYFRKGVIRGVKQ